MKQQAVSIRLATPADAREIALMSRDLIESGLGWRYDAERVTRAIRGHDRVALVAGAGSATTLKGAAPIAGFALMEFGEERAHLVLLAVRPSHRRQGVGRRLLAWLVESALTAGIASLHLELRASNEAARAFYGAMGFTETVLVRDYYRGPGGTREPALRMLRMLRSGDASAPAWTPPTFDRET